MADYTYEELNQDDQETFQYHSKGIDKAVRETFSTIPADFELKPATIQKITGCGTFYHFKIILPDGQFANVSFNLGSLPLYGPDGQIIKQETHYTVDSTPSSSAYE